MGKFKPKSSGFKKLHAHDSGLAADINKRVQSMGSACGEGYKAGVDPGTYGRMRGYVVTATNRAKRDALKNNTLVSNADSLR